MKCRGLFTNYKVVYVPVTTESTRKMMSNIKTYATHHSVKIKTEVGLFIKQNDRQAEKVIRCEVIGEIQPCKARKHLKEEVLSEEEIKRREEVQKRREKRNKRNNEIIQLFKSGLSVDEISSQFKMSRQGIYYILNSRNVINKKLRRI